jgi:hypothetical protein
MALVVTLDDLKLLSHKYHKFPDHLNKWHVVC